MPDLPPLLYLSAEDVHRGLPMPDAIAAMRAAFLRLYSGQVNMPSRGRVEIESGNSALLLMPCHVAAEGCLSVGLKRCQEPIH